MKPPKLPILFVFCTSIFILGASESQEVFYKNNNANIEFRILAELEDDFPSIYLPDQSDSQQKVSQEIVIGSIDIAGFTIGNELHIYFEPNSWGKVRETTIRLKGKRIALVKDGKIISSPRIWEPFSRSGVMSSGENKTTLKWALKGFTIEKRPSSLDSDEYYIQFLNKWIVTHSKDFDAIKTLAYFYLEIEGNPGHEKALPLFQKLAKAEPDNINTQMKLIQCYMGLGQLPSARTAAHKALTNTDQLGKIGLLASIGEIHYLEGHKDQAIKNLTLSLETLQNFEVPTPPKHLKALAEQILKEMGIGQIKKNEMIEKIKSRIEYIQTH